MSIIVTGASGQFGRATTEQLFKRVPPSDIILVTRSPEALADAAAAGATVRYGDFNDPASLPDAFAGGEKMLLISTSWVGQRAVQHGNAINAAVAAGVRHIAYTSFVSASPESPALVSGEHLATEELIKKSGAAYTFLRDSQYAEAVSDVIAPLTLSTGKWLASAGEGRVAFVSRDDCVACAAVVLTEPGHENKIYHLTGPELLSFRDAARLIEEAGGRPVEYVVVSDEELLAHFDSLGVPREPDEDAIASGIPWSSNDMVSFDRAIREGYLDIISDDVETLLGRPPRSLQQVLAERADKLNA